MQTSILLAFLLLAQAAQQSIPKIPTVSVSELPPEQIPKGTCKESYSGYLEISQDGAVNNSNISAQQIGAYIKRRLGEGYSLSLYPQTSGRIFVVENCVSKH